MDARRACGSNDDACRVFRKMLESGHPPADWSPLLAEVRAEGLFIVPGAAHHDACRGPGQAADGAGPGTAIVSRTRTER